MTTWADAVRTGLTLPEAELGEAHEGSPALLVRGRQFGRLRLAGERGEAGELLQFWVADPQLVHAYVEEDPVTFCGARGYSLKVVMARLDRLDERVLRELLVESWRCRAPVSTRRRHPDLV